MRKKKITDTDRMNWLTRDRRNGNLINPEPIHRATKKKMWGLRFCRFEPEQKFFNTLRQAIDFAIKNNISVRTEPKEAGLS